MPRLLAISFRPPLAIARLGGSPKPLENYVWRDDPTIHGAAHTVIEPATSLEVQPDGSLLPYRPSFLRFADEGQLRPVAPFFELWATIEWAADDAEVGDGHKQAGDQEDLALTGTLLARVGGALDGVTYSIHVANRKAARRTGDNANAFEAQLQVKGDDFARRELLAVTTPKPNLVPLVTADRPIPLGTFQVIRPLPRSHLSVDLDVLRVRFTPAHGQVYGPPSAVEGSAPTTGRLFPIVPPANRILNPSASWLRYDGSYATYNNPEPSDTYDGADQDDSVAWGVVDDTCDGVIGASLVAGTVRYAASARISVGPPDFAPDRRPFVSLADDLTDRDVEPSTTDELRGARDEIEAAIADLFARVFETASLINLDILRTRALGNNGDFIMADASTRVGTLPLTDDDSMTAKDTPYADEKVRALVPDADADADAATTRDPLPYTTVVPLAHERLADLNGLVDFFRAMPERVRQMLRPAYGAFADLHATVNNTDVPDPGFRDARIDRDQAHDMRMPPYMRDELGTALSLTRKQYLEVLRYLELLAGAPAPKVREAAEAAEAPLAADEHSPLQRRVNRVLHRIAASRGREP